MAGNRASMSPGLGKVLIVREMTDDPKDTVDVLIAQICCTLSLKSEEEACAKA